MGAAGRCASWRSCPEVSLQNLRDIVVPEPRAPGVWVLMVVFGNALVMQGKYQEATDRYEGAPVLRPTWDSAIVNRDIPAAERGHRRTEQVDAGRDTVYREGTRDGIVVR